MIDSSLSDARQARLTLVLTTLLHAFTHAYSALLLPLYLLVVADMKLPGVKHAAFVVTVYNVVYWGLSFVSGMLADRFDRRLLLTIGQFGNAIAVLGMGLTRSYEMLLVYAALAGVAGSFFHPAANALIPGHFPRSPGMAIGLLGAGSGMGFFLGPQYAGWRAESATWHLWDVADWQRPLVELGLIGIGLAFLFLLFAKEAPERRRSRLAGSVPLPEAACSTDALASLPEPPVLPIARGGSLPSLMRWQVVGLACTLGFRDFAGVAGLSLASLFLRKAYGFGPQKAGLVVGCMMLLSVIVNPVAVYLSPGARRLPALLGHLAMGAMLVPLAAHVPGWGWVVVVLCLFQTCQLGSYAISDAATLERVAPAQRGRVVGLFLSIAGTLGATGPWIMGGWVDYLGERATDPTAYAWPFAFLSGCLIWAMLSPLLIRKLGSSPPPPTRLAANEPLPPTVPSSAVSAGLR